MQLHNLWAVNTTCLMDLQMLQVLHRWKPIPEIWEEDIPKLAHYADKEANPLYPVPVLMDTEELEHIYHMIMEGHDQ